jgi:hypothetical protein
MPRNWFGKEYQRANEEVPFFVQDAGLTSEHITAFKEYTDTLLKPRETKTQKVTGCALSLGGMLGIIICIYILTDGFGHQKFDNGLKNLSLSTVMGILAFLAGKTGKDS